MNSSRQFKAVSFIAGVVLLGIFSWNLMPSQQKVSTKIQRTIAQDSTQYCLAIRGNGELQPAHWGAMARTIEQLGLPAAMAGGSSASITMFMMEAMASHPLIAKQSLETQKQRASLLWKSLQGFFQGLRQTQDWQNLETLYGHYSRYQDGPVQEAIKLMDQQKWQQAKQLLQRAQDLGLISQEAWRPLMFAMQKKQYDQAFFHAQQLQETISVFGLFNAETDANLFFRSGLVNFEKAAESFGKIADFYSALGESAEGMKSWEKFFAGCAGRSVGLTWSELTQREPSCHNHFEKIVKSYLAQQTQNVHFENRPVGSVIPSFPATSVLVGNAVREYQRAHAKYFESKDPRFGRKFILHNPDEVRFAYWGEPSLLETMSKNLDNKDEKSRRFLALGNANWKQVLALSPAEPGLAPLKPFQTVSGQKYISAGGWPDLQPVSVLKAVGCENVIYLTRQGGESLFAQGVAKRLMNLQRDWSQLRSSDEAVQKLNNEGDPTDMSSLWSRLYNLANPKSSISRSLQQASAILCTNWNAFDVKTQFTFLIEDAYRSSYWVHPDKAVLREKLRPSLKERKPGCQP